MTQGLTGLYGNPSGSPAPQYMDQGVLEARAAPGTATSHDEYGNQSFGYGGTVPLDPPTNASQQAYDAGTDAEAYWGYDFFNMESPLDQTPTTHDVAWPRGIPQGPGGSLSTPGGLEIAAEQMELLHGTEQGGSYLFNRNQPTGHEETTHYTTDDYVAPNQSMLAKVPNQIKGASQSTSGLLGGGGSGHGNAGGSAADVDQGYGVNNTLPEFNAGHSIRRVQHDKMPMDYTLLHGEQEVPFYGRHQIVGQMDFDGPDSPYYQQGSLGGAGLGVPWEGHIGPPTEYIQPPEPETVSAPSASDTSNDVYAWG
jgi:hypothetical protein